MENEKRFKVVLNCSAPSLRGDSRTRWTSNVLMYGKTRAAAALKARDYCRRENRYGDTRFAVARVELHTF